MQIPAVSPLTTSALQGIAQGIKTTNDVEQVGKSFDQVLSSLNESQQKADSLVSQLSSGQDVDLHNVMIATEENDINFRVAMAIRDRLVDAYREVMRMNV